jgi:hypothetical protein
MGGLWSQKVKNQQNRVEKFFLKKGHVGYKNPSFYVDFKHINLP